MAAEKIINKEQDGAKDINNIKRYISRLQVLVQRLERKNSYLDERVRHLESVVRTLVKK